MKSTKRIPICPEKSVKKKMLLVQRVIEASESIGEIFADFLKAKELRKRYACSRYIYERKINKELIYSNAKNFSQSNSSSLFISTTTLSLPINL